MADLLETLTQDHANLRGLLAILERQVGLIRECGQPDYDVLLAVMTYFLDYPELCHHPREDVLAERLIEKGAAPLDLLSGLAAQHEDLSRQLHRFSDALHAVLDEKELPREDLVRLADELIAAQRLHMDQEEQHFFPLARTSLSAADLAIPQLRALQRDDPLRKAGEGEDELVALRETIAEWVRENERAEA